ncbi:unnamed protein product [Linum trigynum]|uniref:Retrotransposon gag domain-containing protein n=1 Tax=Linum trigynum TaxID=586398 RepID=A0AAV2FAP6_9ROSI
MGKPQNNDVVILEEHNMGYYWTARAADMRSPIQYPQVLANNFKVSTFVITMQCGSMVFYGKDGEYPRLHLRKFQLRYFSFTLEGQAKEWLDTRPLRSITTFANLADKFLTRYHPPSKMADLEKQITHQSIPKVSQSWFE